MLYIAKHCSQLDNNIHCPRHDTRASHYHGNPDVEIIWHGLALDKPILSQMVAVVRGVDDVGVVKLSKHLQLIVNLMKTKLAPQTFNYH